MTLRTLFGVGIAAIAGCAVGIPSAIAHPVGIEQNRLSIQSGNGFSFSYTNPRVVPYPYSIAPYPIYSAPRYYPGSPRSGVYPPIAQPPIVYPQVAYPPQVYPPQLYPPQVYPAIPVTGSPYAYPYGYVILQTVDRPAPQIIVDPQYGVRFKEPGY